MYGLNSDEHRKYGADLSLDKNVYMERLERRARGSSFGERDFKNDFSDVLKVHESGPVPPPEMARLLQEEFLRPIRRCLENVYSKYPEPMQNDASDPFSRAIAYVLRETETISDTTDQVFVLAAQRGRVYWSSCPAHLVGVGYLVDNFQTWSDLLVAEKRSAVARRMKAIVDRLVWDDVVLTMDRAGASRTDIGRAYQAIDKLTSEVKGDCLDASLEVESVARLVERCHRSRDGLLDGINNMSRFVNEVSQAIEQSQSRERRTVGEFFHVYIWQIVAYFLVIWVANIVVAELGEWWRVSSGHHDHPPELGPESGAPPRPSPVPGHTLLG
jgi:hypothetical protein